MVFTSDSSSDSEDDDIFQAICDPTMSANYGPSVDKRMNGSNMTGHYSSSNKIEPVTGDVSIDSAIHLLKRNIADLAVQQFNKTPAITEGRPVRAISAGFVSQRIALSNRQRGGALVQVPYAVKRMAEVLDSQVTLRSHNKRLKHLQVGADDSSSNSQPENLDNGGDERLQLLQNVAYDPSLPQQDLDQTNDEWLRKVKKRYNPCYYSSEEEDIVESRCRALALPATLIASGGLKSIYAEHRNANPLKVQRVRLCKNSKNGVLLIAPLASDDAKRAATVTQNVVVKKQTGVTVAGDVTGTLKEGLLRTQVSKTAASQSETGSAEPAVKKIKKKARKRGPKKKKNVGSINGNHVEQDTKNVPVI